MTRAQEQTWLIVAVAIFAHAALLLALLLYNWREGAPPVDSPAGVAAAPLVVAPIPEQLKPEPVPPPVLTSPTLLGESTGEGDSIARVDLPDVTRGPRPEAFEQAWTRQKPSFETPSQSAAAKPVEKPLAAEQTPAPEATDTPTQQLFGPQGREGLVSFAVPREVQSEKENKPEVELAAKAIEAAAKPADATPEQKPQEPAPQATASSATPDPADAGKSDLDAFAVEESATFARGGIEARKGRQVELVRPRVDLSFLADATRLQRPLTVKLQIDTDKTGKPREVKLLQSSGSSTIDDAVRLAIYDSWFGGKMPDSFPFTISFR
jgi:outer membrane biosynthesis protein TonB